MKISAATDLPVPSIHVESRPSPGMEAVTAHNALHATPPCDGNLELILRELLAIRADMVDESTVPEAHLSRIHPNYRASASNLLHYLTLRRRDLRPSQLRLAEMGLSSLGRAESHVLATVDAVLEILHRLVQRPRQLPQQRRPVSISQAGNDCSPNIPKHCWVPLLTGMRSESWSPCQARPQTTICWFMTCSNKAWIACASIALMTTQWHDCG